MIRRIIKSPLRIGLFAFGVCLIVVVALSFSEYSKAEFWSNVLVEAHGMLLDILVLGVFVVWLHGLRERSLENKLYQNEIDDFRGWKSDEASHRIAGNIKRLSKNRISKINLSKCFLKNVSFPKIDLSFSSMYGCDLGGSNLRNANLSSVKLRGSYLGDANFKGANFTHASLEKVRSPRANFRGANFESTILVNAQLWDSDMSGGQFRGADLAGANLGGVNLHFANLLYAKNYTVDQLLEAKSLNQAHLPDEVVKEIKERNPHLLTAKSKKEYTKELAEKKSPNNKIQPTQ